MITLLVVGLLLAVESTCGKNIVTSNETVRNEIQQKSGLMKTSIDEENIYRKYQ